MHDADDYPPQDTTPRMPWVPVSVGELVDKLAILQIKSERLTAPAKRANVACERDALQAALDGLGLETETLARLSADLKRVNESLWVIEDALREHERNGDFGAAFVELARSVYRINDQRAELKRAVNRIFGSALVEEKSYSGDQQL